MGRKAKAKQQHPQSGKAIGRETSSDIRQPDQVQARSTHTASTSAACPTGTGSNEPKYLSCEELAALAEGTQVVVDMSAIFKKKCLIYTLAWVVNSGLDSHGKQIAVSQELVNHDYREAVAFCTSVEPEGLFHAMNTGGETEIKLWKLFSAYCLLIVTHRYLVHQQPLPIRLEGNPPLLLAIRNRARITNYWSAYTCDQNDEDVSDWQGGQLKGVGHMNIKLEELGNEDPAYIDVSHYLTNVNHVIEFPKNRLMQQIQNIFRACQHSDSSLEFHKEYCEQLRKDCAGYSKAYNSAAAINACVLLAIYDRLMYGKPLRIMEASSLNLINEGQEYEPGIISGKGGYEVHGEFVEGAGEKVVHLPFEAVDPYPNLSVLVDMSQEMDDQGNYSGKIIAKHGDLMRSRESVVRWMSAQEDPDDVNTLLFKFHKACSSMNPSTYDHAKAGSKEAMKQWCEHLSTYLKLVATLSAAYNKPIRLCYEPDVGDRRNDPKIAAHEDCLRDLCLKHYKPS